MRVGQLSYRNDERADKSWASVERRSEAEVAQGMAPTAGNAKARVLFEITRTFR